MSRNKKIDLSPLPEQSQHYSQYEQSEFHWGRITLFSVILLLLVSFVVYNFIPSKSVQIDKATFTNKTIPTNKTTPITSKASPLKEIALLKSTNAGSAQTDVTKQALVLMKPDAVAVVSKPEAKNKPVAVKEPVIITKQVAVNASEAKTEIKPHLLKQNSFSHVKPASVLILNSGIKRASLSLSIKDDEPGKPLNQSVVISEKGIIKVILFTEMKGIRGHILFHDWYRNGKRQARVKIPVNVNNQRSYSSKYINNQMLGQWQVKVVDAQGEPYISADFEVINGNSK